jgi:hypothetical protein
VDSWASVVERIVRDAEVRGTARERALRELAENFIPEDVWDEYEEARDKVAGAHKEQSDD